MRRLLAIAGVAVAVVTVYLAITGALARRDLQHARSQVAAARAALVRGDDVAAHAAVQKAMNDAASAHSLSSGFVWAAASSVPLLGGPLDTLRGVSRTAADVTRQVLPAVVTVAHDLSPSKLHAGHSAIRLTPLQTAAPSLEQADAATAQAQHQLNQVPSSTWLPAADRARKQFGGMLDELRATLNQASTAAQLLPSMLGGDGTRRYILVFENEAESRGLGGLPGAYAIVRASHGEISFEKFANDGDLHTPAKVNLGADFNERYADTGATRVFQNSDMSPHYPWAAQIWVSMWERQTGQHLDGAIATDPTALSYLLAVTGPTKLPDGTMLSASNVVPLTESTAYSKYLDTKQRKKFFLTVAQAAAERIATAPSGRAQALTTALGRAVGERRLLVWSAHQTEEKLLANEPIAGELPETSAPFIALTVNNAAGNKIDYYLDRTLTYSPGACAGSSRLTTVTVTLHNGAPTHGLPAYVTPRSDVHTGRAVVGSTRLLTSIYATAGATLQSLYVDGAETFAVTETERGHPVWTTDLVLNPGQTRTLTYQLQEPRGAAPLESISQPMPHALAMSARQPSC
jgi:hypothetical protein